MPRRARIGSEAWLGHVAVPGQVRPEHWPQVDADALPEDRRAQFMRRKKGIELYFNGASEADIRDACGFGRSHIYRLITERCLAQHPDGNVNGWRGALPHRRVKEWSRTKPLELSHTGSGTAGALQWLFESPGGAQIEAMFRKQIIGKVPQLASAKRPKLELFTWLIKELRAAGLEARGEWPFNVEKLGYVSICKFIDKVMDENPRRQRQLLGGKDAERKARAGDGADRPDLRVFQRVECDAHKLDTRMVVLIPSPHGGYETRTIRRVWVIVIIEVASRTVLGYHLSLHPECNAEDVLRAVKRALTRWTPLELLWSDNAYVDGACLPSGHHDRYLGACWDEFSVDGAMANICNRVERQLLEVVGSTILKPQDPSSYTSRRSKDDRPFIESFFGQLAKGGFHRLSTTTGSKPADKRGADPEQVATESQFQLEYAEELLDTLIANYNARPHSGLGWRSPLAQLDFLTGRDPERIRQADTSALRRLVSTRKLCTLKGGVSTGRRPYFHFANARYSAEWLVLRTDLIGKLLWLQLEDEDDARFVSVSNERGEFLGVVRAAPPWHRSPHTLYMRQAIRALEKRRALHLSGQSDAVEELIRYAEGSMGKKLPPHPAYLEARRVLRQHAEELMDEPMVARASETPSSPSSPSVKTTKKPEQPTALEKPGKADNPRRPLPPMEMAKTW
jgi:transposase InsO family protein